MILGLNKPCLFVIILFIMGFIASCCSWNYNKSDFEFTKEELDLLGPYKVGDTVYFESNFGDIDTITVVEFSEERHEGGRCFISTLPYHIKNLSIKHLPNDRWAGTSQSEGGKVKITYQSLIAVSKSPLDSQNKKAGYSISFKGFTTRENALGTLPEKFNINGKFFPSCYKVKNGYPEKVKNPDDIELIYWTAKYGLIAYASRSGETWLRKSMYYSPMVGLWAPLSRGGEEQCDQPEHRPR